METIEGGRELRDDVSHLSVKRYEKSTRTCKPSLQHEMFMEVGPPIALSSTKAESSRSGCRPASDGGVKGGGEEMV